MGQFPSSMDREGDGSVVGVMGWVVGRLIGLEVEEGESGAGVHGDIIEGTLITACVRIVKHTL